MLAHASCEYVEGKENGMQFLVFLVGYILSQFYRSFLAVIAPELSSDLHLSAADLGNISACWFAAFAIVQFAVGSALDRHGPRRTLPVMMLAGVAGALVFAHADGAGDAMLAMALIGAGCSAGLMGPLFVFARMYPPDRFAMLSSLIIGLGTLGNLLGGTPLALASEAIGWRGVFYGLAAVTLASALLIALLVDDPPSLAGQDHRDDGGILAGLKDIVALRSLWPVWPLMAVGYGILITERGLWVGPYLAGVHELAPVSRGNVIFLMACAIALGAFAYGPLESWLKQRRMLVASGSIIAGMALLTLAVMPGAGLQTAAALLAVFGFAAMTYGPMMAHVRHSLPDRLLGRGMTFANFLCMGGAGLLQVWSGTYVADLAAQGLRPADVYAALHFALAAVLLSAAFVYLFSKDPMVARR